jgi:hypothetical protein
MFFNKKPRAPKKCNHIDTRVVAYDWGYCTKYEGDDKKESHHLTYTICRECGKNRHVSGKPAHLMIHAAMNNSILLWKENGMLALTSKCNIYDENYESTSPSHFEIKTWKYKPMTGVGRILKTLEDDPEFIELSTSHAMVADAFGELETVIKLHEGMNTV